MRLPVRSWTTWLFQALACGAGGLAFSAAAAAAETEPAQVSVSTLKPEHASESSRGHPLLLALPNTETSGLGTLERLQARQITLHERVAPAVVSVDCQAGPLRERFYGSGVVLSPSGLILTSTTAVPPGAAALRVRFASGEALAVVECARHEQTEAVLLTPRDPLARPVPFLELGQASSARVGDRAFTAGNPHQTLGRDGQVYWSAGTLSGRFLTDRMAGGYGKAGLVLETDAAVNPGSDGGALVDAQGRLLGLLRLGYSSTRRLGTAVPVDSILAALPKIRETLLEATRPASGSRKLPSGTNPQDAEQKDVWKKTPKAALGDGLPEALRAASRRAEAALVRLHIRRKCAREQTGPSTAPAPLRKEAFTEESVTGVLIDARGTLLTCAAQVQDALDEADAVLSDGRRFRAKGRGRHLGLDVALFELRGVDRQSLPFLPLASSPGLQVGSFVTVLGAPSIEGPADAGAATRTCGIVSALERLEGWAVQTDARINAGNAGGPVVDLSGHLVGIATQVSERKIWASNSGVGFFAPSERILPVLEALRRGEVLQPAPQSFLGVRPAVGETTLAGVQLAEVIEGSAAWRAGLRRGDVLTSMAQEATRSWPALLALLKQHAPGATLDLEFVRASSLLRTRVTLGERNEK